MANSYYWRGTKLTQRVRPKSPVMITLDTSDLPPEVLTEILQFAIPKILREYVLGVDDDAEAERRMHTRIAAWKAGFFQARGHKYK